MLKRGKKDNSSLILELHFKYASVVCGAVQYLNIRIEIDRLQASNWSSNAVVNLLPVLRIVLEYLRVILSVIKYNRGNRDTFLIPVTRLNYNLCPLYMPNATVYYIVNLEILSNLFKKNHSSTFLFVNALHILFYQVKAHVLTQSLYIIQNQYC